MEEEEEVGGSKEGNDGEGGRAREERDGRKEERKGRRMARR